MTRHVVILAGGLSHERDVSLRSGSRLAAAAATVRLLPPISISAVPRTTSRPLTLALPVRNSLPIVTSATSLIRTGTPARVVTTICEMSSTFSTRPLARTT